jgi:hypothetical protein
VRWGQVMEGGDTVGARPALHEAVARFEEMTVAQVRLAS